jgi:hypothetical protein
VAEVLVARHDSAWALELGTQILGWACFGLSNQKKTSIYTKIMIVTG